MIHRIAYACVCNLCHGRPDVVIIMWVSDSVCSEWGPTNSTYLDEMVQDGQRIDGGQCLATVPAKAFAQNKIRQHWREATFVLKHLSPYPLCDVDYVDVKNVLLRSIFFTLFLLLCLSSSVCGDYKNTTVAVRWRYINVWRLIVLLKWPDSRSPCSTW